MTQSIAALMGMGASGGISDDKFMGIVNSFQDISNLEIRKYPKQVQLSKALIKDSGTIIVDKINCALTVSSTGDIIAFGDAGNIYVKAMGGTRQKVYTHSTGYAILGCIEFNQYIYWATLDKLHRTDITSIATAITGGTLTPTDLDWKTLNGITYSNGLQTTYTLDASTKLKVGEKIYVKKNYNLTDVGVSSGTTAPTKAYLQEAPKTTAIAFSNQRLYTTAEATLVDLTTTPTWTERRPLGDTNIDWKASAVTPDGQTMYVTSSQSNIWKSADGGTNWTEQTKLTPTSSITAAFNNFTSGSTETAPSGVKFKTLYTVTLTKVTKVNTSTATRCRLFDAGYNLLATGTVSGDDATFSYNLVYNTDYIVEWDNSGSNYTRQDGTGDFTTETYVDVSGGTISGSASGGPFNITGIITQLTYDSFDNLSMSGDGTKIIASRENGRIYYSVNSGTSRTEATPAGAADKSRKFALVSQDGSTYLVGNDTQNTGAGRLYSATDPTSWTERQPDGNANKNWSAGWLNYDGTKILVSQNTATLYKSIDSGANWTTLSPGTVVSQLCSNNDLSIISTASYYTIDFGVTWAASSGITGTVSGVYSDFNGQVITATSSTRVWKSLDGGATFTERQPAGNVNKTWNGIVLSQAIPLQTVNVTTGVATFSTSLTAGKYYNILFDKEGSSWDARYKAMSYPLVKTDINYIFGLTPIRDSSNAWVITSIGTTVVNDIAHPMITSNGTLYIGDGQYVATIDPAGAYIGNTLTLAEMDKIYDITYNNAYVRIYAIQGTNTDVGIAYFWDGVQEAPDQRQELPGKFRNVTMRDNIDYAIMGTVDPILYFYPYQRQVLKRIDNLSSGIKSMINYKNYLLFGCKGGVYSWGNFNKDYPESLNLEFKTSNNNTTDDIGCIWNSNGDLYVGWKNGTSYGIDKLSTTTYALTGHITTKVYYGKQMWKRKDNTEVYISHKPLITGQKIEIYTQKNLSGGFTLQYTIDSTNGAVSENSFLLQEEYNEIEFKVVITGPGTSTPELYEFILRYNEEDEG